MTADPPPESPHPYADARDPQAQRTRAELWVILAIVAVVIVGGLVWRAVTGHGAGPQAGWNRSDPPAAPAGNTDAAAGAGLAAHGAAAAPRPVAP